jgi:hypothetical protein
MKRAAILFAILTASILLGAAPKLQAQQSEKQQKEAQEKVALKDLINSQHYMFLPQSMLPLTGRTMQVTYGYDLRVISDTLNVYLPYAGKAFTVDYANNSGGIKFKTSSFDYVKKDAKKDGWDISITPKNIITVSKLILHVSSTGYASLLVTSNTRDNVSFNGVLQEIK